MKEYLIIRLIDQPDKSLYWLVVRNPGAKPLLHGTCNIQNISSELSHMAKNRVVVVLVPGEQVLLTTVAIPAQQKRYVANAVPYLLEDQLCNDVEKSHFIVNSKINPDKDISISIVSRERMDQRLALSVCPHGEHGRSAFPLHATQDRGRLPGASWPVDYSVRCDVAG